MSYWPEILQTGDEGRVRPVHRRDVGQRAVWTDWREAAAEDQLGRGTRRSEWHFTSGEAAVHTEAADDCARVDATFHTHLQTTEHGQSASKGSRAAKPECKNGKSCLSKAILQKCCCYLFLYLGYILYHDYLLVFIDLFFVTMQDLLHYRKYFCIRKCFIHLCAVFNAPVYSIVILKL